MKNDLIGTRVKIVNEPNDCTDEAKVIDEIGTVRGVYVDQHSNVCFLVLLDNGAFVDAYATGCRGVTP